MPIHIGELIADVTVQRQSANQDPAGHDQQAGIDPRRLADRVYRLMKTDMAIARERE